MKINQTKKFRSFYILLFFVVLYLPIISVILYSFNQSSSTAQFTGFTLDWYRELAKDKVIIDAFKVSIEVGIMTAVLSAFLGTATALIAMYVNAKTSKVIEGLMIFPLLIPEVALGIALLIFFSSVGIPFGRLTLVLSHSLFCVPYVYIMVNLRLQTIDISIIEAAKDLGASTWHIIKTILLPLVSPAIVTASLLALAMSLDDVVISTYMSGASTSTLPVHIFSMMKVGATPKVNALSTVVLLATFLVVGLSQIRLKPKKQANRS